MNTWIILMKKKQSQIEKMCWQDDSFSVRSIISELKTDCISSPFLLKNAKIQVYPMYLGIERVGKEVIYVLVSHWSTTLKSLIG